MDRPTPRVNAAKLAEFGPGKIVRLIGKVISLDDDTAILQASDGGQVTVKLNGMNTYSDSFVEVIGTITESDAMKELSSLNLGDNIDMAAADKVVQLTSLYPDVFPTE
ncbi:hypothetical protein JCM8097_005432 [Rhodosporidiobolus ruineniae]